MELLITGFMQATLSGLILLFLTRTLDKNSKDAQRANDAEKHIIQRDLEEMTDKFSSMESKHDALVTAFHSLKERVLVMIQGHEDIKSRLFELIESVDTMKRSNGHGRVIKKI